MMKRKHTIFTAAIFSAAVVALSGCVKEKQVVVHAGFTTDKDVYEINEDIHITNTSYAENANIIACRWEWGSEHVYGLQMEEPLSFPQVGDYDIKLTATSDVGNVSATFVKTIKVQDTNIRPVADFTYTPQTGIRAGETEVQFTDASTDEDGTIVGWEWKFGTTVVNEQNPKFTFPEFGEIEVSLTVTDNMKGTNTKTVTIEVERGVNSLECIWEQMYDESENAFVKFTSPATNVDGSMVYALSSGYYLVAYTKDGGKKWSFNGNIHGADAVGNNGKKESTTCGPSVDKEGNIFMALGFNERDPEKYESGVFAVTPEGTQKWYAPYGRARYIAVLPAILGDNVLLTTQNNPANGYNGIKITENGQIYDRNTGAFKQMFKVKWGNFGGIAGNESLNMFVAHCGDNYGSRVYDYMGEEHVYSGTDQLLAGYSCPWWYYTQDDQESPNALGYYNKEHEDGRSSQPAMSDDGKVYLLYANKTSRVSATSVLYCYDLNKYPKDNTKAAEPEWVVGINGEVHKYDGQGVVIGNDGTLYVTTGDINWTGDGGRVTAVNPDGSVKWEAVADGDISGCAAVDNEGYVYYNDCNIGKLVKLSPEDGSRVSEIVLAPDGMRSSPTISCDGTIYCTGMKDGHPTLFAVKGSATGHGTSWSQLGGNPQKSCVR